MKAATLQTFARRKLHTRPPTVEPSASWRRDYPRLSDAHPDAPSDIDAAVDYLADFVARIDKAD